MSSWELCISVEANIFRFTVCKYDEKHKKILVSKCFTLEIPQDFKIYDKANVGAIVGLIRTALKANKININKYYLCLCDKSVITRVIKLPKMDVKDLESFMELSIAQYFPINSEDYYFDYRIQEINEKDDKVYYNLFLVALPKIVLETYSNILLKCGLRPKNINVYADVIANLFSNFTQKPITIIDIGYSQTEVIILENKNIFINSFIDFNLVKSTSNISEDNYLKGLTLKDLGEDFNDVLENVENYLNFFSSRYHGDSIQDIFFIGEGANLNSVIGFLKENMSINITSGKELFKDHIMPCKVIDREKVRPELYYSCLGLLLGGIKK